MFDALATEAGRTGYWAESAPELDGRITFNFLDFEAYTGQVLRSERPREFAVEYFDSVVQFTLESDSHGGTDLSLLATRVSESMRMEMAAGWVSVLMAMKAAVDFGVDLRNHDASRTWKQGYADN